MLLELARERTSKSFGMWRCVLVPHWREDVSIVSPNGVGFPAVGRLWVHGFGGLRVVRVLGLLLPSLLPAALSSFLLLTDSHQLHSPLLPAYHH